MKKINRRGFTLIELLIVMAIISIIAAVVFVALDPLRRFRDSRDAARWTDVSALVSAIKIDQVDNGGAYMAPITAMTDNTVYMIIDGTKPAALNCDASNAACGIDVAGPSNCVDLSGLVTDGYLGKVPASPNGAGDWGGVAANKLSGYTIEKSATGILTVRACEAENTGEIKVSR
jgi:type IV pilus assembly protein PilA